MSKIKTREIAEKGIKTLNKTVTAGERMKSAYIRTREQAVDTVASRQESANEYASDQMEHTAEDFSREVVHDVGSGTQRAVQKGREVFQKQREKAAKKKESENTLPQPDKPSEVVEQPMPEGVTAESIDPASQPEAVQPVTERPIPCGEVHSYSMPEPTLSPDRAASVTSPLREPEISTGEVELAARNERLPQKIERLRQQTSGESHIQQNKPTAVRPRQSQPVNPTVEVFETGGIEVQSEAPKSPVERGRDMAKKRAETWGNEGRWEKSQTFIEADSPATPVDGETAPYASSFDRGRDLAKKRAEVQAERKRWVKNQPTRVPATPTPHDDPQKVIHTPTPSLTEAPAPTQTARPTARHIGNGRTVRNDIKKIPERTIKTAQRTIKTAQKTKAAVKTAEQTARTTIKTAEATAKAAHKSAQAAARAEKVAVQTTRASAKAAAVTAKAAAKAVVMAVKATIAAVKSLISALAAGGGVAGIAVVVICLVGLLVGSVFGIFFSGEDSGSGQTMQTAVREINAEYENKLTEIRTGNSYDVLEMSGSRAVWREVLAVYAVKTTTDPDNPQDVASMDDGKKALLKEIFWAMHTVSYTAAVETRDIVTETDDGSGNIVETSTPTEVIVLYITVAHKTASEMADSYDFTDEQKAQLAELLDEEYQSLWSAVLYGIGPGDGQIVEVALAQVGNSGDIYWSWYGFDSRVEWCACFVSWCANECGFIDAGIIPKFSSCSRGVEWFQTHGLWQDNSYEPRSGDIIFFDWDKENVGQDGVPNHVGIVEKVENGYVYTVEGNSGDMCRENRYAIGYYEIFGYGTLCP